MSDYDPARRALLAATLASTVGACARRVSHAQARPASPRPPRPGETRLPPGGVMPTRQLGSTGVRVSLLGLGGFHIGTQRDPAESVRIVRQAIDHGVTFLDNCWDYNGGESEARMGRALRDGYRARAFLMTKLDGRARQPAMEQLEQSLRRLQTDHIDLVQMHEVIRPEDPDRIFAPGGAIEALLAAKQAGKLRFIGFTGHKDPAIHLRMLRTAAAHGLRFDTVQMPLNAMDPHFRSFERQVLPQLVRDRTGVLGMKSLGSGELLKSGVVEPVECLHYAMNLPTSVVITGCDSVGVLEQALAAAMTFRPLAPAAVRALLARTAPLGRTGRTELFKTSGRFDGTAQHAQWLETSRV